jgi:hypothetical protein
MAKLWRDMTGDERLAYLASLDCYGLNAFEMALSREEIRALTNAEVNLLVRGFGYGENRTFPRGIPWLHARAWRT